MHLALNIVTFGLLSLYLNKKKENAERKKQARIAEILRQEEEALQELQRETEAKLLKEQQEAEQKRQLEIKKAEREAETRRFIEAEKQHDRDFDKDPKEYIKANYKWVDQLLTSSTVGYTHYFGNDRSWTQGISITFPYTKKQALSSRAFCIKMENDIYKQIWSNGEAYGRYQ